MSGLIYLDECGDQIFITNRIRDGKGNKNPYPEYYGVNNHTGEKVTPAVRSEKRAEALLKEYAQRKSLMASKGWATCYGEKCLSCNSDICDGHVSMRLKTERGIRWQKEK
jgi:hypothetical protein